MKTKLLEIRDDGTLIVMLCVDMNPDNEFQRKALRRYGYPCDGAPNILITHANGGQRADNDPYSWGGRTYPVAHKFIIEHWDSLNEGDVVDVEFILDETLQRKVSELETISSARLPTTEQVLTAAYRLRSAADAGIIAHYLERHGGAEHHKTQFIELLKLAVADLNYELIERLEGKGARDQ